MAILAAVTLTYWRESAVGLLVIALMCGGDGLADIVGRRFGSVKLPHNGNKSWAGSAAMFLGVLCSRPTTAVGANIWRGHDWCTLLSPWLC